MRTLYVRPDVGRCGSEVRRLVGRARQAGGDVDERVGVADSARDRNGVSWASCRVSATNIRNVAHTHLAGQPSMKLVLTIRVSISNISTRRALSTAGSQSLRISGVARTARHASSMPRIPSASSSGTSTTTRYMSPRFPGRLCTTASGSEFPANTPVAGDAGLVDSRFGTGTRCQVVAELDNARNVASASVKLAAHVALNLKL